MIWIL